MAQLISILNSCLSKMTSGEKRFACRLEEYLEDDRVIVAGIDNIHYVAKELPDQVRLMYVGMTRARSRLLITASENTVFTDRLVDLVAP